METYNFQPVNVILIKSDFYRKPSVGDHTGFQGDATIATKKVPQGETEENEIYQVDFELFLPSKEDFQIKAIISMVGLFKKTIATSAPGITDEEFENSYAADIIIPFIREHLASLSLKAGVGAMLMPIITFSRPGDNLVQKE